MKKILHILLGFAVMIVILSGMARIYSEHRAAVAFSVTFIPAIETAGWLGNSESCIWLIIHVVILSVASSVFFMFHRRRVKMLSAQQKELERSVQEKNLMLDALQHAMDEVERLNARLEAENIYLQHEFELDQNFDSIVTGSRVLKSVLKSAEQVAATDATVLIQGETGTGKELLARAIHSLSCRCERPLVKIDCGALPPTLIESELFGHEKGAFTGALTSRMGRFEVADKGTVFFDEIGELPLELQVKLLRMIQDSEIERVGSTTPIKVDVRIIAATHRDLKAEVQRGNFREDLYYRLNVFPIHIPPLRERVDDIPLLVKHFVRKYSQRFGKNIELIPQHVLNQLQQYTWPGNVRELENIIERAVIISPGKKLLIGDWLTRELSSDERRVFPTLAQSERSHILKALEQTNWRVSGEKGAARLLDINPQTLVSRMKKLKIQRNNK